jgi:hypothetical protein
MARFRAILLAGVVLAASATAAQAQFFGFPYGYNGYGGGGMYVSERIPYFALHPPVYYKHPVPRAYGYSPFAYPPGYMTPPRTSVSSETVTENPYVVQAASPAAVSPPPPPLLIKNPFVHELVEPGK